MTAVRGARGNGVMYGSARRHVPEVEIIAPMQIGAREQMFSVLIKINEFGVESFRNVGY